MLMLQPTIASAGTLMLLNSTSPLVPHGTQTFSSAGTFTLVASSASGTMSCYGPGGTGVKGAFFASPWSGGGGAGGGAFASTHVNITSGQSYTGSIGAIGSVSNFIVNGVEVVRADYGRSASGTTHGAGGLAENSIGDVRHSGGDGSDGCTYAGGSGGGSAGSTGNGSPGSCSTDAQSAGGGHGSGVGGDGGDSGSSGVGHFDATDGQNPGGGGGGAYNSSGHVGAGSLGYCQFVY